MARVINELSETADFKPGDRVVVKTDTSAELTALPESLLKLEKK